MKYLSDRYVKVYTHKGIDICTLKVANPSEGDEFGYKIDKKELKDMVYNHPEEAIAAIDKLVN